MPKVQRARRKAQQGPYRFVFPLPMNLTGCYCCTLAGFCCTQESYRFIILELRNPSAVLRTSQLLSLQLVPHKNVFASLLHYTCFLIGCESNQINIVFSKKATIDRTISSFSLVSTSIHKQIFEITVYEP